ncbi:GGDEF domain-containing protein [Rhodococcus sp. IEGM 1330]|uniref:GGDEF domain-containing protein n=1 Tax=Rhodococcus sp. IEGM 1330 TaxID=3082225 RepID=UPI002954CA12|nr:GGDEF domain-containing protein [Rhodococcus sp. IEGM 1330]MDV8023179.1 GGDEF domain-containing protein [Rhodococcus sp. IEGM 1330]
MFAVRPFSSASGRNASRPREDTSVSELLDLDATRTRLIRLIVGLGTFSIGLIGLLSAPSEEYCGWRVYAVVAISLTAFPVALRWVFGRWPGRRLLSAFIVYSDISIAVSLVMKDTALTAMGGTVLFAVITMLAVIAVPPLPCAIHMLFATAILSVVAVRTVQADIASGWVVAAHSSTMLLIFASPLVLVVYVSELRSRARESLVDPLTGLHNRRGLFAAVAATAMTTSYVEPRVMCAVAADVDGMKRVNDNYGHHTGDAVLVDVAQHLRALAANRWIVARLGGDEFACIAVGRPADLAARTAELVASLTQARMLSGLTVSVGSAAVHIDADSDVWESAHDVLRIADSEMYRAKRSRWPA